MKMIVNDYIFDKLDYGKIVINLKSIMKENDVSIYQLSKITGIKYDLLKNYYYGDLHRIDLSNIAKICYALSCDVSDIIKYEGPESKHTKGIS